MTATRFRLVCFVLAIGVSGAASIAAQRAPVTVSVHDGVRATMIARLVDGEWVSAEPCMTSGGRATTLPVSERLTVTGDIPVQAVRAVGPGTKEWVRLTPTIMALLERREQEQRLTTDAVVSAPRVVDWIYATEGNGAPTYYFEASRRVADAYTDVDADTDPPGTLRIAVAGFLRDSAEGLTSLGTKSELRWEQDGLPAGPSRADLTPLGVLPRSDRSVWVMKGHSGARTWFSFYEVAAGRTRTLLTTRPARC